MKTAILIGVVCALMCAPALRADDPAEQVAAKGALTWVAMVDDGKYAESWDAAAKVFQSQLTQDQWKAARRPARSSSSFSSRRHSRTRARRSKPWR